MKNYLANLLKVGNQMYFFILSDSGSVLILTLASFIESACLILVLLKKVEYCVYEN